ncbi:MAG: hypothetical protein ACTS9Y_00170 [Methylophilus sp.]|uniref:hypothetical protein n=1 Tax=Methylophilus sp. TaxID=29541 RepID=UPI003F9F5960
MVNHLQASDLLSMQAFFKAFIELCKQSYDQTYSPDDAIESVLDASKNSKPFTNLMICLKREAYLGFSYPHEAITSLLVDECPGEVSEFSRKQIVESNWEFLGITPATS